MADETVVVPLKEIQVDGCLNYVERLVVILDRNTKALQSKVVNLLNI